MSILKVDTLQPATSSFVDIAGHVIGYGHVEHTTQLNVTSTSYIDSGISLSYTAKKANSKLLISWCVPCEHYDGGSNSELIGELLLYKDGSSVGSAYNSFITHENIKRSGGPVTAQFLLDAGDTNAHTWKLYSKTTADTFTIFRYNVKGSLTIMEITQ